MKNQPFAPIFIICVALILPSSTLFPTLIPPTSTPPPTPTPTFQEVFEAIMAQAKDIAPRLSGEDAIDCGSIEVPMLTVIVEEGGDYNDIKPTLAI